MLNYCLNNHTTQCPRLKLQVCANCWCKASSVVPKQPDIHFRIYFLILKMTFKKYLWKLLKIKNFNLKQESSTNQHISTHKTDLARVCVQFKHTLV